MIALLDGDIFAYRAAASAENDPAEIAIYRARDSVERCLEAVGAKEYYVFLSDKKENNYRYKINPDYKANRTQPPPRHLQLTKDYLIESWQANVAVGMEADDALGITQVEMSGFFKEDLDDPITYTTIICSIDKDLLMIPGMHYNFVREEFQEVSYEDGLKHFYKQLLIGDRADNIFGVDGIGKVKAAKHIDPLASEEECYEVVKNLYNDDARLLMNGQCLWIRQQKEQLWRPPIVSVQNEG